jgi:uncharacterized membrane protein YhaH (DUF805 family)
MLKAAFSFQGRVRRREYCLSFLLYLIISFLLYYGMLSITSHSSSRQDAGLLILILLVICWIFMLSQGVRRCHDLGKSGWYQFLPYSIFWLLFADSEWGLNRYGPNPKGEGNIEFSFENENKKRDE